jgi:tetratricopeptide (TPR) repeat protein
MKLFNVFLSSAMTGELDRERDAIGVFFQADPVLKEFFRLYAIEEHASPRLMERAYIDEVKSSDILILLLDKQLRAPVRREFYAARDAGLKVFVYIRHRTDERDEDLATFIGQDAYAFHCGSFTQASDLYPKIKGDLLADLTQNYSYAIDEARRRTEYIAIPLANERPRSSSRYYDQSLIGEVSRSEQFRNMDTDQLIILATSIQEETGNLKKALLLYEVLLDRENGNWQAYNNRGLILTEMGYADHALFSYQRALEYNPQSDAVLYNIGDHYRHLGRYDEAMTYYQRAILIKPDKASALGHMTSICLDRQDYATALEYAERAFLAEQSDVTTASLCLALAHCGRGDEALRKCESLKGGIRYRWVRSYIFYVSKLYADAIAEIDACEEDVGIDYALAVRKAHSLIAMDRISEVMSWIAQLERTHSISGVDYNNLGWSLFEKRKAMEYSVGLFEKAVQKEPMLLAAWINLQCILMELKRYDEGVGVSDRAIKYHPDNLSVVQNRAQCLFNTGNVRAGIDYLAERMGTLSGRPTAKSEIDAMVNESLTKVGVPDIESFERLYRDMLAKSKQANKTDPAR